MEYTTVDVFLWGFGSLKEDNDWLCLLSCEMHKNYSVSPSSHHLLFARPEHPSLSPAYWLFFSKPPLFSEHYSVLTKATWPRICVPPISMLKEAFSSRLPDTDGRLASSGDYFCDVICPLKLSNGIR